MAGDGGDCILRGLEHTYVGLDSDSFAGRKGLTKSPDD
jgi:hypothetical protein